MLDDGRHVRSFWVHHETCWAHVSCGEMLKVSYQPALTLTLRRPNRHGPTWSGHLQQHDEQSDGPTRSGHDGQARCVNHYARWYQSELHDRNSRSSGVGED